MPIKSTRFGPGTFKLGVAPGTEFGCQVQSMGVNVSKDEGDSITALCGDSVPGAITYTYALAGTVLQDLAEVSGLMEMTWDPANEGVEMDFTFVPSTDAGASAIGKVIVDPLPFGTSDGAYGDVLTSDFEWTIVGRPSVTFGPAALSASSEPQPAGV